MLDLNKCTQGANLVLWLFNQAVLWQLFLMVTQWQDSKHLSYLHR